MRIITKVIGVIAVCFFLLIASFSIYLYNSPNDTDNINLPYLEFMVDEEAREIIVSSAKNLDFNWADVSVDKGYALLPTGSIDVEDKITNCYGSVILKLPEDYGYVTYEEWDFIDRPSESFEDLRFFGHWESEEGDELNFNPDGTYVNAYGGGELASGDTASFDVITVGNYKQSDLLVFDDINQTLPVICDTSFSVDDTVLDLYCYNQRTSLQFKRTLSDDLFITILNASQKLDDCLSFFVSNYSNETHEDVLTEGLNVSVTFTEYLSTQDVYNLSNKNIEFNIDLEGNIICNNTNYSIQVNSLQDLYTLAYRVDVLLISADDVKFSDFGCS